MSYQNWNLFVKMFWKRRQPPHLMILQMKMNQFQEGNEIHQCQQLNPLVQDFLLEIFIHLKILDIIISSPGTPQEAVYVKGYMIDQEWNQDGHCFERNADDNEEVALKYFSKWLVNKCIIPYSLILLKMSTLNWTRL